MTTPLLPAAHTGRNYALLPVLELVRGYVLLKPEGYDDRGEKLSFRLFLFLKRKSRSQPQILRPLILLTTDSSPESLF